ncbi:cytochrome B [Desertivirga arenae]|uniref:cytochrome B n=1 Tax=Desertivirga arenae TaxID=2810309 RepID=UPI001A965167|nr:cytochrome B [Pedobacter sp. SYSU D00823]
MYSAFLTTHSIIRFAVIIASVLSILLAFAGWFGNKEYTKGNKVLNLLALISAHLQLVVGLILYFISPIVNSAEFGAAMKNSSLRYWKVEHMAMMIIAIVLITVGYSKSKRALASVDKHRTIAIFYTIAVIVVLAALAMSGRGIFGMTVA